MGQTDPDSLPDFVLSRPDARRYEGVGKKAGRIAFVGNCQAAFLADEIAAVSPGLDIKRPDRFPALRMAENKAVLAASDVVVGQISPFGHDPVRQELLGDIGDRLLPVPNTIVTYLWPNTAGEATRDSTPWTSYSPPGLFTLNIVDRVLYESVRAAQRVDVAISTYLGRDIASEARVSRLKAFNMAQIAHVSSVSGCEITGPVERYMGEERLFHIYGHPTTRISTLLFDHVLGWLEDRAPSLAKEIDAAAVRQRIADVDGMHYGRPQAFVHPSVAEHFGLSWTAEPATVHPNLPRMANGAYIEAVIRTEYLFKTLQDDRPSPAELIDALSGHPAPEIVLNRLVRRLWDSGQADAIPEIVGPHVDRLTGIETHLAVRIAKALRKAGFSELAERVAGEHRANVSPRRPSASDPSPGSTRGATEQAEHRLIRSLKSDDLDGALAAARILAETQADHPLLAKVRRRLTKGGRKAEAAGLGATGSRQDGSGRA